METLFLRRLFYLLTLVAVIIVFASSSYAVEVGLPKLTDSPISIDLRPAVAAACGTLVSADVVIANKTEDKVFILSEILVDNQLPITEKYLQGAFGKMKYDEKEDVYSHNPLSGGYISNPQFASVILTPKAEWSKTIMIRLGEKANFTVKGILLSMGEAKAFIYKPTEPEKRKSMGHINSEIQYLKIDPSSFSKERVLKNMLFAEFKPDEVEKVDPVNNPEIKRRRIEENSSQLSFCKEPKFPAGVAKEKIKDKGKINWKRNFSKMNGLVFSTEKGVWLVTPDKVTQMPNMDSAVPDYFDLYPEWTFLFPEKGFQDVVNVKKPRVAAAGVSDPGYTSVNIKVLEKVLARALKLKKKLKLELSDPNLKGAIIVVNLK